MPPETTAHLAGYF